MISIDATFDFYRCSVEPSPCDQNPNFTNSVGPFSCICKQGFAGDGGVVCEGLGVYISAKINPLPLFPVNQKSAQFCCCFCFVLVGLVFVVLNFHHIGSICSPIAFAFIPRTLFLRLGLLLSHSCNINKHNIFLVLLTNSFIRLLHLKSAFKPLRKGIATCKLKFRFSRMARFFCNNRYRRVFCWFQPVRRERWLYQQWGFLHLHL